MLKLSFLWVHSRYNLKRKVADLPPVTREWFEEHKSQLSASLGRPEPQVWIDPLTKKKFSSEHTYNVYVNSNKYKEIVRKSGAPAPKPVVQVKANEGTFHVMCAVHKGLLLKLKGSVLALTCIRLQGLQDLRKWPENPRNSQCLCQMAYCVRRLPAKG